MRTERQKLRQTCDPCRKAKVKCNKQTPMCSRCLASGASCDYGISIRGGRWKNGQKMGARVSETQQTATETPMPQQSYSVVTTPPMLMFPIGDSPTTRWQEYQEDDIWTYDTEHNPQTPFSQYNSATPNAFSTSSSSSLSSLWATDAPTKQEKPQPAYPPMLTPPYERPTACSCLVVMLQMLQNLHQNFPQSMPSQSTDFASGCYATVLDMNEEAAACCSSMLLCPSCQGDESSDFFIILAAVIRKVLSLTEAWAIGSQESDAMDTDAASAQAVEQQDDKRLKIEIALIGLRKMKDVLGLLKQAGQMLQLDYERLTCSSLTVSLSARLKLAMDGLEAERAAWQ